MFTITFYINVFVESSSFIFLVKDSFPKISGFNAQNCKIPIPKRVSFLQNVPLVLVLDHETCALSNEIGF